MQHARRRKSAAPRTARSSPFPLSQDESIVDDRNRFNLPAGWATIERAIVDTQARNGESPIGVVITGEEFAAIELFDTHLELLGPLRDYFDEQLTHLVADAIPDLDGRPPIRVRQVGPAVPL